MEINLIMGITVIILSVSDLLLRKWIVGPNKNELPDEGRKFDRWGRLTLMVIVGIPLFVLIWLNTKDQYSEVIKVLWRITVVMAGGFQLFVDWKYLKGTREYLVSLIVLIEGIVLVYVLL